MSTAPVSSEYQVGRRLALVCADAPERQTVITTALEQLGYTTHLAADADDAIQRVRRDGAEVVVIDEHFQGATPLDTPVLAALSAMPMSIRRYVFVALLGREYKTFDNMMAFATSANVVINPNDLPQLAVILRRGIIENDAFFKTLREVLQDAGKR